MEKYIAKSVDSYQVFADTILTDNDRKILTTLYQPIIGYGPYAFFMTLWSQIEGASDHTAESTHKRLLALMDSTIYQLDPFREKLEAVGLMKTYYKKGNINRYIYVLMSPLTPRKFFGSKLHAGKLKRTLGKAAFEELKQRWSIKFTVDKSFNDISSTFEDVFYLPSVEVVDVQNIKGTNDAQVDISFDVKDFIIKASAMKINVQLISDEVVEAVKTLRLVYDLTTEELCECIPNAVKNNGLNDKLDIVLFTKLAREKHNNKLNVKTLENVYKVQPKYKSSVAVPKDNIGILIQNAETLSPYNFLKSLQGGEPTQSDLKIIEHLMMNLNLEPSVVNILLDYVVKVNDGKLVKAYIEKIAASLMLSKIATAKNAYVALHKKSDAKQRKASSGVKRSDEVIPSWYGKDEPEVETSQELLDEINELLKKI